MADIEFIELVIKIDKEQYEFIKQSMTMDKVKDYHAFLYAICEHIKNGIPLPKRHGDLIDRDDLLYDSYCINDWSGNEINIVDVMTVKMADAIIEADKEESEKV